MKDKKEEKNTVTIDTSNLVPGTWIKNYKELCELLKIPVGTGYQKKKQLQEFERYFSYEKKGIKYFIKDIYEDPLPINYKTAHNAKYIKFIENILLSYLAEQSEEHINIKKTQLYSLLGMVNDRYYKYHNNQKLLTSIPELNIKDINDFYKRCDDRLSKILKSSLESLKRRSLLDYDETYIIGSIISINKTTEIIEFEEASDYERQLILRLKRETLRELGLEIESEIYFKNKENEYYDLLNEKYRKYGWSTVFKAYHFIFNKDHILDARDRAMEKEESIKELNNLVVEALNTQAENRYDKEQHLLNQFAIMPVIKLKYPIEYVKSQKILSNNLIKL